MVHLAIVFNLTISRVTWSLSQKIKADAEGLSKKLEALDAYKR